MDPGGAGPQHLGPVAEALGGAGGARAALGGRRGRGGPARTRLLRGPQEGPARLRALQGPLRQPREAAGRGLAALRPLEGPRQRPPRQRPPALQIAPGPRAQLGLPFPSALVRQRAALEPVLPSLADVQVQFDVTETHCLRQADGWAGIHGTKVILGTLQQPEPRQRCQRAETQQQSAPDQAENSFAAAGCKLLAGSCLLKCKSTRAGISQRLQNPNLPNPNGVFSKHCVFVTQNTFT